MSVGPTSWRGVWTGKPIVPSAMTVTSVGIMGVGVIVPVDEMAMDGGNAVVELVVS